ncbi:MAG: glycosyltransferase, partial [Planctomycetes bacterium]|nr:glycosyltransferase [Planctomycetota bacterium]
PSTSDGRPGSRMQYPTVSVIVLSFNSLRYMEPCFSSLSQLDYPKDRLEVVVVSDESTDGTDEIVREYADRGIQLVRLEPRGGKNRAVNTIVPRVSGEIVVLCDANIMFESSAISRLLRIVFSGLIFWGTRNLWLTATMQAIIVWLTARNRPIGSSGEETASIEGGEYTSDSRMGLDEAREPS